MRAEIERGVKFPRRDIVEPFCYAVGDLGVQELDAAAHRTVAVQSPRAAIEEQYRFA
jgi:hypothetical protein